MRTTAAVDVHDADRRHRERERLNYNWNWSIFFEPSPYGDGTYLGMLAAGLSRTLATSGSLRLSRSRSASSSARCAPSREMVQALRQRLCREFFRNIPLLMQFFLWFFVVPELLPTAWGAWLKSLPNAAFLTSVVCLGFFHSIRVAVILSAGINRCSPGRKWPAMRWG